MQLSMFAYALASLQLRDEALLASMARELRTKFPKCNILEATLIANSYARLLMVERTLFGQLIPSFCTSLGRHFHAKDIARTLNAYAKVQLRSTVVFDALAERSCQQVEHMDCHSMSIIANSHARLLVTNQALFEAMAKRLHGCARTCTMQAVSNLLNAYSKFTFEGERRPGGPGLGLTDGIIDCLAGELPRFRETMTAHCLCVMAHAVARAGQHLRRPELLATFSRSAFDVGLENFTSNQLGMLAVAFAEMSPPVGGSGEGDSSPHEAFWAALASVVAERRAELEAADASNVALAFASIRLKAETVAALDLVQHCKETPPAVASALLVAHALSGIWDKHLVSRIAGQMPDFLWQATEALACRLALALWLAGGRIPGELRKSVEGHILRVGSSLGRRDEADAAALRSACQGFVALAGPTLHSFRPAAELEPAADGAPPRMVWVQVVAAAQATADGETSAAGPVLEERFLPRRQLRLPSKLTAAGRKLAGWLAAEHRGQGDLLLRLARTRPRDESDSSSERAEGTSIAQDTLEAALTKTDVAPGHGVGGLLWGGRSGTDMAAVEREARAPELAALLLPGVAPRPLDAAPAAVVRRLSRVLRRWGLQPASRVRVPPLLADVCASVQPGEPEGDAPPPVPVAFLIDDENAYMRSFGADGSEGPQSARISPEAVLHGFLLALDGWLVVRVHSEDLGALLAGEAAAGRLQDALRGVAARWVAAL